MNQYKTDMHIHSKYSWDSRLPIKDILESAQEHDIKTIAITDHVEFANQPVKEVMKRIKDRNKEIDSYKDEYDIKIIKGVEVSEPHLYSKEMNYLETINDLDVILGSIHHIYGMPIRKVANNKSIFYIYLKSMLKMVEGTNIDVLAHLDYIKRYRNDVEFDDTLLDEILRTIIEKHIALEINTSGIRRGCDTFPSDEILNRYFNLGGKMITIGSDAHKQEELFDSIEDTYNSNERISKNAGIVLKRTFHK